ncbi:hypothetical protein [Methylocucumis oryzae]|uniref:hypothetical protein n=1 Tax=Methylocucumis oryzae TaxID=1632867 RepID=UPI0006965A04|nr:hypothetical protein [Methylocucumis oryzae]
MTDVEIAKAKHDAASAQAKSAAMALSAQVNLLNTILDKMAADPEVLAAITLAKPELLALVAEKLEKHVPNVLKIRILLPGVNEIDEKSTPRMGFADLDLVRETLAKNQSPGIQGDKGLDRHLAIARRIMLNNQPSGVILASLDEALVLKTLKAISVTDVYLELRQANLVVGALGNKPISGTFTEEKVKVSDTDWEVYYQYRGGGSIVDMVMILSVIAVPMLFMLLTFFVGYRKTSEILTLDLQSLVRAVKDMMTNSMSGNYPVQMAEMSSIISTLIQFKRVLENQNKAQAFGIGNDVFDTDMNIIVTDDEDFNLDGFFNDKKL